MSKRVIRFDYTDFGKPIRMDNGWMLAPATITRTGVFEYRLPDGKVRRELRPPASVFDPGALDSFDLVPVTLDHPPVGLLDAENTKKFARGTVSSVKQDGANVSAKLLITDSDAIKQAESGRNQLSCGYTCDCDETPGMTSGIPGVADGQFYDAIQKNIRGNHVALVYRGRAGENAKLRLDSKGNVIADDFGDQTGNLSGARPNQDPAPQIMNPDDGSDSPDMQNRKDVRKMAEKKMDEEHLKHATHAFNDHLADGDGEHDHDGAKGKAHAAAMVAGATHEDAQSIAEHVHAIHMATCSPEEEEEEGDEEPEKRTDSRRTTMKMVKVKLDSVEYEVTEQASQAIDKIKVKSDERKKERDEARAEAVKQKARADSAEESLKAEKERASKFDINKAVNARLKVVHDAEKLLPKDHKLKLDEMPDVEIKKAAILAKFPSAKEKLEKEGEVYVNARFDAALETVTEDKKDDKSGLNRLRHPNTRADESETGDAIDLDARRKKMVEAGANYAGKPKAS